MAASNHAMATKPKWYSYLPVWNVPNTYLASWVVTLGMTILSAAIRLSDLTQADGIMFDETYYVKDAWSLHLLGYEGQWSDNQNEAFASGDISGLSSEASYVVHPPVGRWLISIGMAIFGQANPFGWRVVAALAGIVGVLLVCRLAWNLFSSTVVTLLAGLFLATDGIHVVLSRIGLLDIFLSTFVLGSFLAVVLDQKSALPRLENKLSQWSQKKNPNPWGPTTGGRPWLIVAGVLLGLACATKWSGIYAVAVLGLFVVFREMLVRRRWGVKHWFLGTIFPDGIRAFIDLVVVAGTVYILSWWSWFTHPDAWGRDPENPGFLNTIGEWVIYHEKMWVFHNGLSSEHSYMSNPLGWLIQIRPTSFWYQKEVTGCATEGDCVSAILALGNPLLWWCSILAIAILLWATLWRKNWATGLALCGFLAMYVPWFAYLNRTVFTFYTVAFAPFVALSVAWMLGWMSGQVSAGGIQSQRSPILEPALEPAPEQEAESTDEIPFPSPEAEVTELPAEDRANQWLKDIGITMAVLMTLAIVGCAAWFSSIWVGTPITHEFWSEHMWFDSWI